MTHPFTRREFTFFYACGFLGCLFFSFITCWWVVLAGGNPIDVKSADVTFLDGTPGDRFRAGQLAYVRQTICSDRSTTIQFYPSILEAPDVKYPLSGGAIQVPRGCKQEIHAFVIPQLRPGEYSIQTIFKFQNNLVGRDEFGSFPSIKFWIVL
jgi:hypothetical protein